MSKYYYLSLIPTFTRIHQHWITTKTMISVSVLCKTRQKSTKIMYEPIHSCQNEVILKNETICNRLLFASSRKSSIRIWTLNILLFSFYASSFFIKSNLNSSHSILIRTEKSIFNVVFLLLRPWIGSPWWKLMYKIIIIIIIIRNKLEFKLVQCFLGKEGRNDRNDNDKNESNQIFF